MMVLMRPKHVVVKQRLIVNKNLEVLVVVKVILSLLLMYCNTQQDAHREDENIIYFTPKTNSIHFNYFWIIY
jgi:hypothetical protein